MLNPRNLSIAVAALLLSASPLVAQPHGKREPGTASSEVRLQFFHFGNFFEAAGAVPRQDVSATGAEYRVAYRPDVSPTEYYANLNVMRFGLDGLKTSYGGRAGVQQHGALRDFNAYAALAKSRPSFEVGNVFGTADTAELGGEYAYRVTPDWQPGVEATFDHQQFAKNHARNNDYMLGGAFVRYRGLGWRITPAVGFDVASRNVSDNREDYRETLASAQLSAIPSFVPGDRLWFNLRYRYGTRDYRNITRNEKRGDWTVTADYKATQRLAATLYYTNQGVDEHVPLELRSFKTNLLVVMLSYGF